MSNEPHDKLEGASQRVRHGLVRMTEGPWTDWYHFEPADPFEDHAGPFYCREDERGMVCGWVPGAHNANAGGNIHGGALMTFADYALFMIVGGMDVAVHGVTMTMNSEFVGAAQPGKMLTARGEVVRAGLSVVFVRGLVTEGERPVLAWSATVKKFGPRG